jgi:hypothetical protein
MAAERLAVGNLNAPRLECRGCGQLTPDSDIIGGLCAFPRWAGDHTAQGCALRYYTWAKQHAGSLSYLTVDAWLAAGKPDGLYGR